MKTNLLHLIIAVVIMMTTACENKWDNHYSQADPVINNDNVEIAAMSTQDYIKATNNLSAITALFDEWDIFETIASKKQTFTILVYSNETMAGVTTDDPEFFAKTCVCDVAITPSKLSNGMSMMMWNGKYLAVTVENGMAYIAGAKIDRYIQTENGYVYWMNSPVFSPKSLYEVLTGLGDDYSMFRDLVLSYEEKVFDKDNSTPTGVDNTGNTVYDSVFVVKNTLMDRYNSAAALTWSMRSEYYNSTMLIPSNTLVENALDNAYTYVRDALSREPTVSDTTKFHEWIVKAGFYSSVLNAEKLDGTSDITSVSGYLEGASASTAGIQWRPTVQKVNTANPIELSNGAAYYVTEYKIPNNVVIHRIKNRFYIWEYCTEAEKAEYFKLTNFKEPSIRDDGGFGPIGPWPYIPYKMLRADATTDAITDKLPITAEFTGIALNNDGTISVVGVPPGEYTLYMGFREKQPFTVKLWFNGQLVNSSFLPTCHYDRSGGGYPEGFVSKDWTATNSNAGKYDMDGQTIATVTITGTGLQPVTIKIESSDLTSSTSSTFYFYHWCLKPTTNNY